MRKKSKIITFFLSLLFLALLISVGVIYLGKEKLDEYKEGLQSLTFEIGNNKRLVYVAADEIKRGSIINESMIAVKEIYTELGSESFFDISMLGYETLIDIPANEPLMASMVSEYSISTEEKEYEITTVELMADQEELDYIDIRIMFPDGSDYLVLPQKKIHGLNMETSTFYIRCTESEILTMTSAIIDTYTITGAKMYAVRYVNGMLQEAAIPNYPVKEETIAIINSDPNVVYKAAETLNYSARKALEEKLGSMSKDELSAFEGVSR